MTNEQAALLAAARIAERYPKANDRTLAIAELFLKWLDSKTFPKE